MFAKIRLAIIWWRTVMAGLEAIPDQPGTAW